MWDTSWIVGTNVAIVTINGIYQPTYECFLVIFLWKQWPISFGDLNFKMEMFQVP